MTPSRPVREDAALDGGDGSVAVLDRHELLDALQRVRRGDFSVQLPERWSGVDGKIAEAFNDIVAANQRIASELKRVGQVVGKEGRTRERAKFGFPDSAVHERTPHPALRRGDSARPPVGQVVRVRPVADGRESASGREVDVMPDHHRPAVAADGLHGARPSEFNRGRAVRTGGGRTHLCGSITTCPCRVPGA